MKNNNKIWVLLGLAVLAIFLFKGNFFGAIVGTETMTRNIPATVTPGQTFEVTYSAVGVTGTWGATIEDTIVGNCKWPNGGNSYKSAMLSDDGVLKKVVITAPTTTGTCTFHGDYKYGNYTVRAFQDQTITVQCTPSWTCGAYSTCTTTCNWAGQPVCSASYVVSSLTQTRTCTDSNNCGVTTGKPVESQTCSYTCTRTITKNTIAPNADTNCDGIISRDEVGVAITGWANTGAVTRDDVGKALQAWASGG